MFVLLGKSMVWPVCGKCVQSLGKTGKGVFV